ncbi:hypothetical protein L1O03_04765 [Corynebacterium uropygiale]|uniref:DUF4190 domain-containing protein n=1 Tax=Corynebacterium uropygiale TaxID=1775911 RepID=A0A9X1QT03_9CORY|nr:hypothetical protein [Corynebacterium uropygiale]MCF4006495.1 hypothetical protein [Corynebacterium uropygiale]
MSSSYPDYDSPIDENGQGYPEYPSAGKHAYPGNGEPTGYPTAPGATVPNGKKNGLALWGLILGIIAIVLSFFVIPAPLAFIVSIAGIIVSALGLTKAKNFHPLLARKGMAIAGLVVSIIALIISAIVSIVIISFAGMIADTTDSCLQYQNDSTQFEQCIQEQLEKRGESNV